MRKFLAIQVFAFALSGSLTAAVAPVLAADAPSAPAAHYSVETTLVGKLLDDPEVNALLKKMIPTVYGNEMFHSMGRDQTLKAIQQFEPEALSDEVLAKIQAELNKLPAKG